MKIASALGLACALPGSLWAQSALHHIPNGTAGSWYELRSAGDVDHDGRPDLIAGGTGGAHVFSGADGALLHAFTAGASVYFPVVGAAAGDVDLDGHADLVVGAAGGESTGEPLGALRVHSGLDGSLIHEALGLATPMDWFPGAIAYSRLGVSVAGAGDVNGDGRPDVLGGRQSGAEELPDAALVFSGLDGAVLHEFLRDVWPNNSGVGVSAAGDANQDGFQDVLVSFWSSPYFDTCVSTVRIHSGADGSVLRDLSDPALCAFGIGLAAAGDLDGDGVDDVVAGTPFASWEDVHFGGALVGISGADGSRLFVREGLDPYGSMGAALAMAGDVNGDGELDLVAGDSGASTAVGPDAGLVHLFAGGAGPRLACALAGTTPYAQFGVGVAAPGDVNLDGFDDVAVLSAGAEVGAGEGEVSVWSAADCPQGKNAFFLGSTLTGSVSSNLDVDEASFPAVAGTRLKLVLSVPVGDLEPIVELVSPENTLIKTWKPVLNKGKTQYKLKLKLKHDGDHRIRVRGQPGTRGDWRIVTHPKLPAKTKGFITTKHAAKSGVMKVSFRAPAGTVLWATADPVKGLDQIPNLQLLGPSGAGLDLTPFQDEPRDLESTIDAMRLPESGRYWLVASHPAQAANAAVKFVADLYPPVGGELIQVE